MSNILHKKIHFKTSVLAIVIIIAATIFSVIFFQAKSSGAISENYGKCENNKAMECQHGNGGACDEWMVVQDCSIIGQTCLEGTCIAALPSLPPLPPPLLP